MAFTLPTAAPGPSAWLAGLLVAALVFTLLAARQGLQVTRSHQLTAESVLRDYAQLAADEFVRRATVDVGYRGYFQLAGALAGLDPQLRLAPTQDLPETVQEALALARGFFTFDPASGAFESRGLSNADTVRRHLASLALDPARANPFVVQRPADQPAMTLVMVPAESAKVWRGFEVAAQALAQRLAEAHSRAPLLPASLADGQAGNHMLAVRLADAAGQIVFAAGQDYSAQFQVTQALGDDYQGLFAGHEVAVRIDPAQANRLVIGGLPQSRLVSQLALVFLNVAMLAAALWLLVRERRVAALRDAFVAEVSHELRTPLTQIQLFSETLLLNRVRSDDESRRALQIVHREARRLAHLVDNVLSFSRRASREAPALAPVALAPLAQSVAEAFQALAPTLSIAVDARPVKALADPDAVTQVLLNLLDNAVKYAGPTAAVTITVAPQADQRVALRVCDNGPGIPASDRQRVFEPYYRLSGSGDQATAGAGIGLSVVRDRVEDMGGEVALRDNQPTGLCVVVLLQSAGV